MALAVCVAASATPASASTSTGRAKMFHFVNGYRREHDRRALRESADVDRLAQHHSGAMAAERQLFHSSSLSTKLRSHDPTLWGENVGMGSSVWSVFRAWTQSTEHRQNMLRRGFHKAGVGLVRSHGVWWATMIFYG
jgi:uncharacterized protein YkwD